MFRKLWKLNCNERRICRYQEASRELVDDAPYRGFNEIERSNRDPLGMTIERLMYHSCHLCTTRQRNSDLCEMPDPRNI